MDIQILKKIVERLDGGENVALVILTETKGSAPGKDNSSMAVLKMEKYAGQSEAAQ